jgi:hypothetical protein
MKIHLHILLHAIEARPQLGLEVWKAPVGHMSTSLTTSSNDVLREWCDNYHFKLLTELPQWLHGFEVLYLHFPCAEH